MAGLTERDFLDLVDAGFNLIPLHATLQLDRETPVSLFQRLRTQAFFLLESASLGEATGRYSFIGLDRRWRVSTERERVVVHDASSTAGSGPLETVRELLGRYRAHHPAGLPDFLGGAVGYVAYDYARRLERLPREWGEDPWPDADFSFPGALLVIDHLRHSTTVVVHVEVGEQPREDFARGATRLEELVDLLLGPEALVDEHVERLVATAPTLWAGVDVRQLAAGLSNFSAAGYSQVVESAKAHIRIGDVFQVVPSQQFRRPSSVDPLTLYRVMRALNPSPYMYLLDTSDATLVGASPEMLVRVSDGVVSTRPIAGTRPRGATEAEDRALEHEVLSDDKEIAEHVMLVDLGRNDVGRVAEAGTVSVERLAHVERFSHLMHLVSQVSGRLREGLDAFDAFNALFPAGTLTGAPKVRAMELIDEFEPVRRGPYGGALGYFALSGNADFAITIRTVSLRHGVATVQAGGGVVADSRADFEYAECINKASAPLLALQIADPL